MTISIMGRFGLILADPPWAYADLGHTRRIDRQYSIMSLAEICAMPVRDIALSDAVLFLWVTAPLLYPNGHKVLDAWGFRYVSNIVWDKQLIGMGHYARIRHEHLLIGVRGKSGTAAVHNLPSVIQERRGKHSVKPEQSYEYIEKMFPDLTKIELFARRRRPGWTSQSVAPPTDGRLYRRLEIARSASRSREAPSRSGPWALWRMRSGAARSRRTESPTSDRASLRLLYSGLGGTVTHASGHVVTVGW